MAYIKFVLPFILPLFLSVLCNDRPGSWPVQAQGEPNNVDRDPDEICKTRPAGNLPLATLCGQLEKYKKIVNFPPAVIAILNTTRENKSMELKILEEKNVKDATLQTIMLGSKYAVETVGRSAEFLEKLKNYQASQALSRCSTGIGALGMIASMCGPIGAGIGIVFSFAALFIPSPNPNAVTIRVLNEGFDEMHMRLNQLEWKIDQIEFMAEKSAVYQMYKENQDRIYKVMFANRQLFSDPDEVSLQEFKDACELEHPLYALEWLYRRSTEAESPFGLHLFHTVMRDAENNQTKVASFYQMMINDMITAAYLSEACIGVIAPRDTDAIWRNRRQISNLLSTISKVMKYWEVSSNTLIRHESFRRVEALFNKFLPTEYKDKIVPLVKSYLRGKYFWLKWYIYLVEGNYNIMDGDDQHFAIISTKRDSKVYTVVLIWTEPSQVIEQEIKQCEAAFTNSKFISVFRELKKGFLYKFKWELFLKQVNLFLFSPKNYQQNFKKEFNIVYEISPDGMLDFRSNKATLLAEKILARDESDYKTCNHPQLQVKADEEGTNVQIDANVEVIMAYYKSKTLSNCYGCLTKLGDALKKFDRLDACPFEAFKATIKNIIPDPPSWTSTRDAANQVKGKLKEAFPELKWSVVAHRNQSEGNKTFQGCNNNDDKNCTRLSVGQYSLVISWSLKSDPLMKQQVERVQKKIDFIQQLLQKELIFKKCETTEQLSLHVYDFMTDPLSYFLKYALSEEKLVSDILKEKIPYLDVADKMPLTAPNVLSFLNFYENKVITVGPLSEISSVNENIATSAVLNPPERKKAKIQSLQINIIYYKPFEMANTLHCNCPDTTCKETNLGNRTELYGCYSN